MHNAYYACRFACLFLLLLLLRKSNWIRNIYHFGTHTHKSTKSWALEMQGEKIDCWNTHSIDCNAFEWQNSIGSENNIDTLAMWHCTGEWFIVECEWMQHSLFKYHDQKFWLKLVDCCADALHSLSMKTGLNLTIDQLWHFVVLCKKKTPSQHAITSKINK